MTAVETVAEIIQQCLFSQFWQHTEIGILSILNAEQVDLNELANWSCSFKPEVGKEIWQETNRWHWRHLNPKNFPLISFLFALGQNDSSGQKDLRQE